MRQRASGTVNPEMKKTHIYVLPDIFFSFLIIQTPKENIMIMPKQMSISDKSMLFDGCPTAKLRKKISVEPCIAKHNFIDLGWQNMQG